MSFWFHLTHLNSLKNSSAVYWPNFVADDTSAQRRHSLVEGSRGGDGCLKIRSNNMWSSTKTGKWTEDLGLVGLVGSLKMRPYWFWALTVHVLNVQLSELVSYTVKNNNVCQDESNPLSIWPMKHFFKIVYKNLEKCKWPIHTCAAWVWHVNPSL